MTDWVDSKGNIFDVPQRFHKQGYEKALKIALASAKASWERHGDKAIGFKEFIQELEIRIKENEKGTK